ncbi:endonuclease domain-containing protein [Halalkalibacter alkalisediminis]|uniref:Endonuclease domain-containing protein n=1 Tax=Halalkalibacter alkalisediminis TaxID=935616 RepID=A0ABV6NFZ8_9BACI|nr:DUF559 domain-containing protein [Halalkalibacter alkalisediminis]
MTETILVLLLLFPIALGLKRIQENKQFEPVDTIDNEYYKCESPIESPCGKYRIDLALMGAKLVIECDGKASHSSPAQKAHDRRKNAFLRKNGWKEST